MHEEEVMDLSGPPEPVKKSNPLALRLAGYAGVTLGALFLVALVTPTSGAQRSVQIELREREEQIAEVIAAEDGDVDVEENFSCGIGAPK